jgi:hypothetical protein
MQPRERLTARTVLTPAGRTRAAKTHRSIPQETNAKVGDGSTGPTYGGAAIASEPRLQRVLTSRAVRDELRGLWADIGAPDDCRGGGNKKPRQLAGWS